jgi:transposase
MPDIIKLGKTIGRHLAGIMEAIRTGSNSAVVRGSNNNISMNSSDPIDSRRKK